jgi:hypothetical protein
MSILVCDGFSQSALTQLWYGVWRRREGGILGTTGRKLRWYPEHGRWFYKENDGAEVFALWTL